MSDIEHINTQFFLTTLELEDYYFWGKDKVKSHMPNLNLIMPDGEYRVVDGELFRLIDSCGFER